VRVPIFPAEAGDVVALASEAWDLRENLSDLDEVCTVSEYALVSELIRGDRPGVDRWFGRLGSLSTVVKTRFAQYVHMNMESIRALLEADLVEAEGLAERGQELGRQLGEDVSGVYGLQMFLVRREQDRLRELAPMVQMLLSKNPVSEMWQPGLIALLVELGMRDEGRQLLNDLVRRGEHLRVDSLQLATLCFMAEACWRLGAGEVGPELGPPLEDWRGSGAVVGNQVSHLGATDRYLAMIARQEGRPEEADRLLDSALEFDRRLGARLWEAHALVDQAELRLAMGMRSEAVRLRDAARSLASEHDLLRVARRCEALPL
jgi:hypothetical protein